MMPHFKIKFIKSAKYKVNYKLGWGLFKLQLYTEILCMYTAYLYYMYIKYATINFGVKAVQCGIVCVK